MKCPYRTKKELKITPSGIAEEEEYKDCLYDACPFYRGYVIKIDGRSDCLRAQKEIESG